MYNAAMPKVLEAYPPLQQLCRNANVQPEAIAARIKTITGEELSANGVIAMLRRGTRNIDYLNAIAVETGIKLQVVSEAGKPDEK